MVALPGKAMPSTAGAYGISTGTIYLNQEWLQSASRERVLAVLSEELGHHLDGMLNARSLLRIDRPTPLQIRSQIRPNPSDSKRSER